MASLLDMLHLHILFIRFGGVENDFDYGMILPKTPLSFLLWKLTPKMRNLLSTAAPHQGPGPPDLFLFSVMLHTRFVPFSLSNQRLWVGIQNKLRLLYPLLSNDFLRVLWNELLLHLRNEQLALIFTMQKQELILYPILLFIEFIKFSTRFQLFSISTKL